MHLERSRCTLLVKSMVAIPPSVRYEKDLGLVAHDVLRKIRSCAQIERKSIGGTLPYGSNTHWRNVMRRHLIAGALACFGSSLFGQAPVNTADQAQGTLNKIQNAAQDGLQKAQNAVDRNIPQSSGSSNLNDGQLNSNLSTQVQGQSTLGGQQRNSVLQDSTNQYDGANRTSGNSGFQSPVIQRQGQTMQTGQLSNQELNSGTMQNKGTMQNNGTMPYMPMNSTWNSSQNNNMQQSLSSQVGGRVYVLRLDANGREFICVDGRPVYFDNVTSVPAQGNSGVQDQYRAGYGNYDLNNGQNTQDQLRKSDPPKTEQKTPGSGQSPFGDSTNTRNVGPMNPPKTTSVPEVPSPDRDRVRSSNQDESKGRQNDEGKKSEFDAKPDVINPSKASNDLIEPKS